MKFPKLCVLLVFAALFLNMQCNEDDGNSFPSSNCGALALIDSGAYLTAETNPYTINSAVMNEECLVLNISASGCDGSTWIIQLLDSGNVSESEPPQRAVKLFLFNNEACLSVISQVQSFDLSALQVDGVNEITINIDDFPDPIVYTY